VWSNLNTRIKVAVKLAFILLKLAPVNPINPD
jgi:hypothetical protein